MTSERPPRVRRKASQAPGSDPPARDEGQPGTLPQAQPQLPPRMPRETMKGFAIRPDADSTMQIGSFPGSGTPFPSTGAGGVIAQASEASYPGPMATPVATPVPAHFIRSIGSPSTAPPPAPPIAPPPSSDNEPTTFFKRDASGASVAPSPSPQPAPIEKPPDTARKLSVSPPQPMPAVAASTVSRQTARIISSNPPPNAATSSAPPPPQQQPQLQPQDRPSSRPEQRAVDDAGVPWEGTFDPASDVEWQKLWLATQRRAWRSLAVVPSGDEVDTLRVAQALAVLAWHHLGKTIKVFDATHLALGDLERRLSDMSSRVARGESVIVAFGPILHSPASLTLARATDAALLCVTLGQSRISSAEGSIAEVGVDKFIGSVIVDPDGKLR